MSFPDDPDAGAKRRWPRAGRFRLTLEGTRVKAEHANIVSSTRGGGRPLADAALVSWAKPLGLEPHDGVVLAEFRGDACSLSGLVEALEPCGIGVAEVKAGLGRLLDARLVEDATREA